MILRRLSSIWVLVLAGVVLQHTSASAQTALPFEPEALPIAPGDVTETDEGMPLKSGDLVRITVVGFPELSGEQTVSSDGIVQLPMAGEISVVGLSSEAAIQTITTALLPYVRRPQVSMTMVDPSPLRVSVSGEVLAPGPRSLALEEFGENNTIRLSEVLVAAGGVTPEADLRNITVRRQIFGIGTPRKREESQIIEVDLWEVIQTGDLSADPLVHDGDEVYVPVATASGVDQQMLLSSTVAPDQVTVSVAGEVRRPGPVEVDPTSDVNAAIAAAGGPTPDANVQSISLVRMGPDGQLVEEEFAFGEQVTAIRHGDLIFVRKSTTSNVLDFLGAIASPLRLFLDVAILNNL